ncbi:MAG TPA: S-layer homology domain-containing protein [Acidimicrobiia bacterium]|jgi:hypothetical protein
MHRSRRISILVAAMAIMTSMTLGSSPAIAAIDPGSAEAQFIDLINGERTARGLNPLSVDPALTAGARQQAVAIRDAGRLFHNPDLGSVTSGWSWIGENVGYGYDVANLHQAFMDSSGHRANILKSGATHIGLGVVVDGSTVWVVEVFMTSNRTAAFTPPFADDDGSPYEPAIIKIADAGITSGCSNDLYCPYALVTRAEMATFLVRAFGLPGSSRDAFSDDGGSTHHANINALAAAGVTNGCQVGKYCPNSTLTRGELATFIMRALRLSIPSRDYFSDDNGSVHEPAINAIAAAGISTGCSSGKFCPTQSVTREQMAGFLANALGL